MKQKKKQESGTTLVRKEDISRQWLVLDASGKTLGRFASEVTKILRGKHKPNFTPHVDNGDGVIILNAEKVEVTGAKEAQKIYISYTGHIGGQRKVPYRNMIARNPSIVLWRAIKGMMPKSRLGKQQLRKLRIHKGDTHPYQAQQPITVEM